MTARFAAWRDAGWIGERWTKIPNVDLWRQIAAHADHLSVSWQAPFYNRPGLWDAVAAAIAKRIAHTGSPSPTPCRTFAAHH